MPNKSTPLPTDHKFNKDERCEKCGIRKEGFTDPESSHYKRPCKTMKDRAA